MDRRNFIKKALQAAAVTGCWPVLSFAEASRLGSNQEGVEKKVIGCMWCQGGCSMIVHIKDGRVIHLTGNPDDPVTRGNICLKPYGSLELLNSPHRLIHPLKRVGARGDGAKFVKVSWDEALDEIAGKLKQIKLEHGGESLGIWASGRSAADGRKLNKAFAKLYGTPNYEKTGPFCNYSGKPAGVSVVGSRHTPWTYSDDDFFSAELYIFVGSNMAATRPVIFQRLKKRKKAGACRIVCIDPRQSETSKIADRWLSIKPGRDLALALGLMHYLIANDLCDSEFIAAHTVGFARLRQEIVARNYDLEWCARTTGLDAAVIVELARLYQATDKAIIVGNAGLSHHTNAVQTHRAFYQLAAITGHFGRPATGYSCLNNGGISTGSLTLPPAMVPSVKALELGKNPVSWLESIEDSAYPYKLRALISTGSPMTQWPDQNRLRRLFGKLELSVYNGLTKNINACYFDYILPAATWIEAGGLAPVSDDSRFVWVPRLVKGPGTTRPDRWWWIELGKRMGWQEVFREELKDPVSLQNLTSGQKGYSVKNFCARPDNAMRAPVKIIGGLPVDRKTLFLDKKFSTPSGKIELWSLEMENKFAAYGLKGIPEYYTDPDLADSGEATITNQLTTLMPSPWQKNLTATRLVRITTRSQSSAFPLYLISGRPSAAIMGHTSHWIRKLNRRNPDQICQIHPETARKNQVKDGEIVTICSAFGSSEARVKIISGIRRDTVFIPYSYGRKAPFTSWKSVNFLTSLDQRCPISGQIAFRGVRVEIKKKI